MRINAQSVVTIETPVPEPQARPALAKWLWERGLDFRGGARLFGCSHTALRNYCRPFSDPERRVPKPALMAAIVAKTDGDIRPPSFYPAALNGEAVADPDAVATP